MNRMMLQQKRRLRLREHRVKNNLKLDLRDRVSRKGRKALKQPRSKKVSAVHVW